MKRSPLKRKTPLRRKSKRRQEESKEYNNRKSRFLDRHPVCEVWTEIMDDPGTPPGKIDELTLACIRAEIPSLCPDSTEIHHKCCGKNRKATYLREDTWLAVSMWGHRFIHENPKLAYERGWLLKTIPEEPKCED